MYPCDFMRFMMITSIRLADLELRNEFCISRSFLLCRDIHFYYIPNRKKRKKLQYTQGLTIVGDSNWNMKSNNITKQFSISC